MAGRTFRSIFLFLLFVGISFADDNPDSTSTFIPNIKPELNVPRLAAENIKIDGDLSEYVWEKAALIDNFTEISPGDNIKPEQKTEGRVFYDEEYLYFGFTAYETDMMSAGIRNVLQSERDTRRSSVDNEQRRFEL
ncbi:MAG: hypothetical protein IPL67_06500 [Ignavibacteria bacterium]|nr:hypothetical protein [Ignavibacteria bacterium]